MDDDDVEEVQVTDRGEQAATVMSMFSGYPLLPTGQPCGVWAFTLANTTVTRSFVQDRAGEVRLLRPGGSGGAGERVSVVEVPVFDPASARPCVPYYAAILTDPVGVTVPSFPKGAEDLIATRGAETLRIELGQERQLRELGQMLARRMATGGAAVRRTIDDAGSDVNRLHLVVVEGLLNAGYDLRVENPWEAAQRETAEEHGFSFPLESDQVLSVQRILGMALSKRSAPDRIAHHIFAVHVQGFERTLPRWSVIEEEKNPLRRGAIYMERGVFLTLAEMWLLYRAALRTHALSSGRSRNTLREVELEVTEDRLLLLERVEQHLTRRDCTVRHSHSTGDDVCIVLSSERRSDAGVTPTSIRS